MLIVAYQNVERTAESFMFRETGLKKVDEYCFRSWNKNLMGGKKKS